jgi:type I restriction enzyme S subunit
VSAARWGTTRLKSVVDCRFSNVDKLSEDGELPVRLCNYTDVYYNESIVADRPFMQATATPLEVQRFRLAVNDVIVTKDSETADDIGIATVVRESAPDLVCGYHLALLRPRVRRYFGPFLQRVLSSNGLRQQMSVRANGVTRFGLGQGAIGGLVIPDPPFDDQQRIAEFLDRKTAVIDELIAKKERLVALLAEKRQALITQLVTKGLDPSVPMKDSGIEWIGKVPAHWDVARVKHVARMESGHTPSRSVPEHWLDTNDIPWVSLNDTQWLAKNDYITDTTYFINELGIANSSARLLPARVVVFTRDATIGKAAITTRPMAVSQHLIAWVCSSAISPEYLLRVFYAMEPALERFTFGATIRTIGMDDVRELMTPVPPALEQAAIVERVVAECARGDRARAAVETSIERLREYRQALITAAVTGQIDVSDERAVAAHDDEVAALGG